MAEHPAIKFLRDAHTRAEDTARALLRGHDRQLALVQDQQLVLARVEAERSILVLHTPGEMIDRSPDECPTCSAPTHGFSGLWPVDFPCATLLALARGWGWKPEGRS